MKKLLYGVIVFIFLQGNALAQDSAFIINGKLDKIQTGLIYLNIYQNSQTFMDSAFIKDGLFHFTGFVKKPYFASLTMPGRNDDFLSFYVEPGVLTLTGRADQLKLLSIKGSTLNTDDKMLKSRLRGIKLWETANSKIYEEAYKEKNKGIMDSLERVDHEVLKAKREIVAAFIKDYPSSVRGAMAILENFSYYAEALDVLPLYTTLAGEVRQSEKGKEIKDMIDVYERVAIGKPAPVIEQYTVDSSLFSLASLKGKFVLIDFWASWCGPCRRENPNLVEAYLAFRNKNFTILGVSFDTKKGNWIKAISDDNLDWNQVSTLNGWDNPASKAYGIKAIPSNVLLDKEGNIIGKNLFGKDLLEKLKAIIPD